jgi:uncharacterized protein YceK
MLRIILLAAVLLLSGCTTVIKGTTQTVPVNSDPSGAEIVVNNRTVGTTPAEIELKRKRDHQITLQLDGYEPATVAVLKSVGGAVWGNIIAGGLIGWGVDATSGAQYNLRPETVYVRLRKQSGEQTAAAESKSTEGISALRELDAALEAGVITDEEYARGRRQVILEYFPGMEPSEEEDD